MKKTGQGIKEQNDGSVKYAFVILHYGDRAVTDRCVESILHMKRINDIEIIIVDNDARLTDEERDAFACGYERYRNITILRCQDGTGFSRANNLGYEYARTQLGADCIIVCNNDIDFIQTDFIERLERSVCSMNCHVLGPDIIRRSNHEPQNPMDIRLRTSREARNTIRMNRAALAVFPFVYPFLCMQEKRAEHRRLAEKKQNLVFYKEAHTHIIPFGACLIFTPAFVEKEEKAFDPETQFYYEEYILANRCFQKGYETGYDPSMKVLHETGSATNQSARSNPEKMKTLMKRTAQACEVYLNTL